MQDLTLLKLSIGYSSTGIFSQMPVISLRASEVIPAAATRISIDPPNLAPISSTVRRTSSVFVTSHPHAFTSEISSSGTPNSRFTASRISSHACTAMGRSWSITAKDRAPEIANAFRNSLPSPPFISKTTSASYVLHQ